MSSATKVVFNSALKELRVILCQTSKSSEGARNFIEKYYVTLKSANPSIPILIRECSNVEPKLYARYGRGKEVSAAISNENAEGILKRVVEFSSRA